MKEFLGALALLLLVGTGAWSYAPFKGHVQEPVIITPPEAFPALDLSELGEVPDVPPLDLLDFGRMPDVPFVEYYVALPTPEPTLVVLPLLRVGPRVPLSLAFLQEAEKSVGATARQLRLHRFTLWCATAMNAWLKRVGLPGTNSDLASSFVKYGKPSAKPCVGCIAVKTRKGGNHVVVVKKIVGNKVVTISPNGRRGRVTVATYRASVFYAYRSLPNGV